MQIPLHNIKTDNTLDIEYDKVISITEASQTRILFHISAKFIRCSDIPPWYFQAH